jgi:hypothetical protein
MSVTGRLILKSEPDGFGFYYGTAELPDGDVVVVNVLPPKSEWRGQLYLQDVKPHETDWVLFVDGQEVARARVREDLLAALANSRPSLARD